MQVAPEGESGSIAVIRLLPVFIYSEEAKAAAENGEEVILVRKEPLPKIRVRHHILTARGEATSHRRLLRAVVCWVSAVAGCEDAKVDEDAGNVSASVKNIFTHIFRRPAGKAYKGFIGTRQGFRQLMERADACRT